MADSETKPRSSLAVWLVLASAMLPLYVLSFGPACWLGTHGYLNGQANTILTFFYSPLAFLANNWEPAGRLLKWYASLWLGVP